MDSKFKLILGGLVIAGAAAVMLPSAAQAVGSNVACSTCHTMHASQDGAQFFSGYDAGDALTIGCVGCHTGTNAGIVAGAGTPFVLQTTAPTYNATGTEAGTTTLAGGNFYWTNTGDADTLGHNVTGLTNSSDAALGFVPPGGTTLGANLTCAGDTTGCHSTGGHHGNTLSGEVAATSVATSFRFLKGKHSTYVEGFEDPDYEWEPTATEHNQYKGKARALAANGDTDTAVAEKTISSFCAACHGNFHNDAGGAIATSGIASTASYGSPWIRHPVDFDMNAVASKADYTGGSRTYSVISPVASATVAGVDTTIMDGAGDAIVMCISCHRAHGTPYADILRWDYSLVTTGTTGSMAGKACFVCHTSKDGV